MNIMGYLNGLTGHPSGKKGHTGATGTRGARGPPGPDFNVMSDGNYDIQDKRLTKVSEGTDVNDIVNKHQLETDI